MSSERNAPQRRSQSIKFETREDDESGKLWVSGYFSVFNSNYQLWEGASESIAPGAFDETLAGDIRALIDHETRLVIGRTSAGTLKLRTDSHGLWADIEINREDSDAMNLYARVQRGDVNQGSFGFDILKETEEYNEAKNEIHWTIEKVKLYEISCVTFPAYEETNVSARKEQMKNIKKRALEAWKSKARKALKGE